MPPELAGPDVTRSRSRALLFQIAVGLSAFLVFLVQPLAAKQILPWFGGGPLVWSASLLFFQLALVAGYAYAHLTRRLGVTTQVPWHIVLLLVAIATLPITAPASLEPADGSAPVWRVLVVLTATVGLPFVLLSATAPLLQDWFARLASGRTPYRLYVVSNIGSLAALLAYPLAVERWLDMSQQVTLWSLAFVGAVAASATCGWITRRVVAPAAAAVPVARATDTDVVPWTNRVLWVLLPVCSSALLLATTNQLTQDVAAVPLLWVVPLAVYLLTYILAFAGWYSRTLAGIVFLAASVAALVVLRDNTNAGWFLQGLTLVSAFGGACLVCHGELVRVQPPATHLTAFYLALAVGGSLGGLFVALGAPQLFDRYVELPLFFLAVVALLAGVIVRDHRGALRNDVAILLSASVTTAFVVTALILVLGSDPPGLVARARSPYGVMRVVDEPEGTLGRQRRLYHGRILHGTQFLDPSRVMEPTSYYGSGSGVSYAIGEHPRRAAGEGLTIGAVGLGTGSVASLTQRGDHLTFFELDPMVVELARRYFGFLSGARGDVEVITGDARLSLERQLREPGREHSYDVIVVDAFSGDAIPVHLLTLEGFEVYQRALRDDGILAVHISNRYLDLEPIVQGGAAALGLEVVPILRRPDPIARAVGSQWLLVTRNDAFLEIVRPRAGREGEQRPPLLWTDSFSSLVSALR